uniref:Uncharacterized protein LOC100373259 isoform X1 n=1 Tax=Saccoglossus kowalevskii TaxID=10224 RepID=A0ABM0M4U7_SACKO|nr:PREDICTED: uncharacterized protein LOC100373259 isoform X1 [Saccoglossus kowalevskii]
MMNKTILVAVFVMVVVAVKQSYGAPIRKRNLSDSQLATLLNNLASGMGHDAMRQQLLEFIQQHNLSVSITPHTKGKRTMTDALNSQLMSQSMSKLQGQALIEMLQKLQRKYGDFTIRTPGKRVTADAFMNEAMRNQYLRDQGAAFREALLALQARQGDFKVGKKSENDVEFD